MASSERQKGRKFEQMAEEFLLANGFTILEKNWQAGHKEIDLIALKDKIIIFVEVKAATGQKYGHPAGWVDKRKRQNLIAAAGQYIADRKLKDHDYRFDLITFFDGQLEHYESAFTADDE